MLDVNVKVLLVESFVSLVAVNLVNAFYIYSHNLMIFHIISLRFRFSLFFHFACTRTHSLLILLLKFAACAFFAVINFYIHIVHKTIIG